MKRKIEAQMTLFLNRFLLALLIHTMTLYRTQSRKLLSSLDSDTLWVSGLQDEERHLDRTQTIIVRRAEAANRAKSKQR